MTRPNPVRHRLAGIAAVLFLAAAPALPSGFQIMTQGAAATGMGLAFTAVANDPSAIFYNPAGLGFQQHFAVEVGSQFITKIKGDFEGANPFPGEGVAGKQHKTTFVVPALYAVIPLTQEVNLGFGSFAQYGLGYQWDGGDQWAGRFISQNAVVQTYDLNPVLSWRVTPQIAIAAGADYRLSRVQLERDVPQVNPLTQSIFDVAHVKLDSSIWDSHAWGWNAGILIKPVPEFAIGASYRSKMTIDYRKGEATFTQKLTGDPVLDALVAANLPQGKQPVSTSIAFPATINLGVATTVAKNTTISLEADWTQWSRFQNLNIDFENPAIPDVDRNTNWKDTWAYRIGVEQRFGNLAVRAGYYRDNTPQPTRDAGPILADSDRNGYTVGFGYNTERWGVNLADLYLKLKDLRVRTDSTDNFFGTYKESVNIAIFSLRLSF